MQPYFFPYLGYYQLANYVDLFVVFDDVNFINRGWINRNNILLSGQPHLITIPLNKASQNKLINEIEVSQDFNWKSKLRKKIDMCYSKSNNKQSGSEILEEAITCSNKISEISERSLSSIFEYCGIRKKIIKSSEISYDKNLKAQDKILDICCKIGCTEYVNLPGGKNLYENKKFLEKGITLSFITKNSVRYKQQCKDFVDNLSMIDILMNNEAADIKILMSRFSIS